MRLFLSAIVLALSACSPDKAPSVLVHTSAAGYAQASASPAQSPDFGSVIFRRGYDTGGRKRIRYFILNGKRIPAPSAGGEVAIQVPPGLHFVGVYCDRRARDPKINETSVTVEPGGSYIFLDQTYLASQDCRISPMDSYES